jgi:hypothetical protein
MVIYLNIASMSPFPNLLIVNFLITNSKQQKHIIRSSSEQLAHMELQNCREHKVIYMYF